MTYQDKLKDPRWQRKRLEILKRDAWCCQVCNDAKSTLHVHHLFYKNNLDPWDYNDKDLITLCDKHHKFAHDCDVPYHCLVIWKENRDSFYPVFLSNDNTMNEIFSPEKLDGLFNEYIAGIGQKISTKDKS